MTEHTELTELEIWTYSLVDWDLLRDDLDSVSTTLPYYFFTSREDAEKAAKERIEHIQVEYDYDDEEKFDVDLKWTFDCANQWIAHVEEFNISVYVTQLVSE